MDPRGRTALITGGGTGIGATIAFELARAGARVVLVGRRRAPLEEVAARVRALHGGEGLALPGDVTRAADWIVRRIAA